MRTAIYRGVAVALTSVCVGCGEAEAPRSSPPPAAESTPAPQEPAAKPAPSPPPATRGRAAAAPAKPAAAAPVQVQTALSKTAVWAGDPVVWTVEIACAPGFDVITDDFAGDKVKLVGLELIDSEAEQGTTREGGVLHRVRYNLRSFTTSERTLRTEPMNVRYYERQAGQRVEDLQPRGEVIIPAARIAWRSTIPDGSFENGVLLRDARVAEPAPALFDVARPVGMSLVLISIAPVVLWAISSIHHARRPRQRRPSARATRGETRNALQTLRASAPSSEDELREAYNRLSETLRRHVAVTTGVPASALASEEIGDRLRTRRSRMSGDELAELVAECDRARYARPGGLPASDRFQESITAAERLI